MTFPLRIARPYRVRFDEAGADGQLRASGFLRYASDLAWVHSEGAGFGRDWYGSRRLTWLIRAIELEVVADVAYGTELTVSTEVVGFRRAWARRRSEYLIDGRERPVAVALTDWLLLNERGAPARVPEAIGAAFAGVSGAMKPLRVHRLTAPAEATAREFGVRRSELDPLGHVNNAAYLDYLDAHVAASGAEESALSAPRRYRAEFVFSAEAGRMLVGRAWPTDTGWAYRLADHAGRELLRAELETNPASGPAV